MLPRDVDEGDREPCAANASTIAAPMPEPPPVIKTRLPRRLGKLAVAVGAAPCRKAAEIEGFVI